MLIDGVEVTHAGFVPFAGEIARYVAIAKERVPDLAELHIVATEDGGIDLNYTAHHNKFERIRRITG